MMIDNIQITGVKAGFMAPPVSPGKLTEEGLEKLSAYRLLARELGFSVGAFEYHPREHNAVAIIKEGPVLQLPLQLFDAIKNSLDPNTIKQALHPTDPDRW